MRPATDPPTQRGDERTLEDARIATTVFRAPRSNTTTVFERARTLGMVGDYQLAQQLGRCVFVAHHRVTRQAFAIRMLDPAPPGRPDLMQRQLAQARALAAIDHPNVVRTIEVGLHDGRVYLVMEYLRGTTLESVLDLRGPPPGAQAIKIGMHVARGLEAAHLRGITHRNLDADSVIVVPTERGRSTLKLVDFEIEPSDQVVRIPRHSMSPELVRGGPIDHRTDLYSLGVLLHRVCTMKYPFEGTPIEILAMYRFRSVMRPAPALAGVPAELSETILRLLCEEPADRFRTAGEVLEALRRAADRPGRRSRPPADAVPRPRPDAPSESVPWPDRSAPLALEVDALPTEQWASPVTPGPSAPASRASGASLLPPLPLPLPPPAAVPEPIDSAADSSGVLIAPGGPGRAVTAVPLDAARAPTPAPGPLPLLGRRPRRRVPWKAAAVLLAAVAAGSVLSLWTTGDDDAAAPAAPAAVTRPAGVTVQPVASCPPSAPALEPDVVLSADPASSAPPTEVLEVREEPPRKSRRKPKPRRVKAAAEEPRAEAEDEPIPEETIIVPDE